MMVCPVIMAGGAGTRLWPVSRQLYPKQFHKLCGGKTLLRQTLERIKDIGDEEPIIICNEDHRFYVAEQLRQEGIGEAKIILEPFGRNTAPAIALAALTALNEDKDPVLLVLPSDHYIADIIAFKSSIKKAVKLAEQDKLVTLGVTPNKVETGYGYIRQGSEIGNLGYRISAFVEKPALDTAKEYVASGNYLWNSGVFIFKASVYLRALDEYRKDILYACKKTISAAKKDLDFIRVDAESFRECPEDSIDYAVMEKTPNAAVVPFDGGWSDVGSWTALWEIGEKDKEGNVFRGDVVAINSKGNFVFSESKLIGMVGIEDVIAVETKDAILIVHKDHVQDVKKLVEIIRSNGREEYKNHREVFRPWGCYDSISNGDRYQVKRITVKPGGKLSVQMHHHRAEHWIVVSGTAKVTKADKTFLLTENESIYISVGEVHALENPGKIPLELIEVQTGSYLGEDDIVRFEDKYGRV